MLDSSPLPVPPPRKLKRTASVASLPSPPPSVEPPKKRLNTYKYGSDVESGSDSEDENLSKGHEDIGRKLLFPPKPLTSSAAQAQDNPFIDDKPSDDTEKSFVEAAGPSAYRIGATASPSPSRRKASKPTSVAPRTPSPSDRGKCSAFELPILDQEDNPFLVDSPPKLRHPRTPRDIVEKPTMTYVFKGIKTTIPNPNYNLPESVYERARLPLSHPDFSPLPTCAPRRLFVEPFDEEEEVGEVSNEQTTIAKEIQTPEPKPRMSKLFVDVDGNPLPDSGPQGIRGPTMDARDIARMAVGPIRGRG